MIDRHELFVHFQSTSRLKTCASTAFLSLHFSVHLSFENVRTPSVPFSTFSIQYYSILFIRVLKGAPRRVLGLPVIREGAMEGAHVLLESLSGISVDVLLPQCLCGSTFGLLIAMRNYSDESVYV